MKIKKILKEKSQRKWWVLMIGLFFFATSFSSAIQATRYFLGSTDDSVFLVGNSPVDKQIKEVLNKYVNNEDILNMYFFIYTKDYTERVLYTSALQADVKPEVVKGDPVYELASELHKERVCYVTQVGVIDPNSRLKEAAESFVLSLNQDVSTTFYMSCPVFAEGILLGYVSAITVRTDTRVGIETMNLVEFVANRVTTLLGQRIHNRNDKNN